MVSNMKCANYIRYVDDREAIAAIRLAHRDQLQSIMRGEVLEILASARNKSCAGRCPGSPPGDRSRCRLGRSHGAKP